MPLGKRVGSATISCAHTVARARGHADSRHTHMAILTVSTRVAHGTASPVQICTRSAHGQHNGEHTVGVRSAQWSARGQHDGQRMVGARSEQWPARGHHAASMPRKRGGVAGCELAGVWTDPAAAPVVRDPAIVGQNLEPARPSCNARTAQHRRTIPLQVEWTCARHAVSVNLRGKRERRGKLCACVHARGHARGHARVRVCAHGCKWARARYGGKARARLHGRGCSLWP